MEGRKLLTLPSWDGVRGSKESLYIMNKKELADKVRSEITKKYGEGSVMLGNSNPVSVEAISSGSIGLDIALGVGGYPRGRISEIFGAESAGKTTLALHAIAEAQKAGGLAAFIDVENALDLTYASALGVDTGALTISQPDNGEQALEIVEALVDSGAYDIIVVDSVAALVPQEEIDGDMQAKQMGLQARLMGKALRKITTKIGKSKAVLIFINQIRQKIGVMYGPNETTSGGKALLFYASVRLEVKRVPSSAITKDNVIIGNRTKVKVVKNKVSPPLKVCEFDVIYGKGVHRFGELLDYGVHLSLLGKKGAWYSYLGENVAQGRDAAVEWLEKTPDVSELLDASVRKHYYK